MTITPRLALVAPSTAPIFDGDQGSTFALTLTGSVTAPIFLNLIPGMVYTTEITQDGAGGHDFAWPKRVRNAGSISTAPGVTTSQSFVERSDGLLYAVLAPTTR